MSEIALGSETRPVIGIPTDSIVRDGALRHWLRDSYVSAVVAAGGAPLLIPSNGDEATAYALYRCLDGLLLSGGGDVAPGYYGESVTGTEADSIDPNRDSTELMLTRWALADDLPILGICRGHQVLNVATGGSLWQDIPSDLPSSTTDHRGSTYTLDRSLLTHTVKLEPGCKAAALFRVEELTVNSLHHQGVKAVGAGLKATGVSPDGLVEVLEGTQNQWVLSVQWHPEELWRTQTEAASLFKALVEAAKARRNNPAMATA